MQLRHRQVLCKFYFRKKINMIAKSIIGVTKVLEQPEFLVLSKSDMNMIVNYLKDHFQEIFKTASVFSDSWTQIFFLKKKPGKKL